MRTTPSSCRTTARRPRSTRRGCTARGCSTRTSSRTSRSASRRSRTIRRRSLESDEDVHSAIERLLGPVGRKIHAGRSRNDQVAAAFRLYVADACAEAREEIDALALVDRSSFAEAEADTLMPGYTHLQRGAAGHARAPPARVGRDARPRPHALRGRRARPPRRAARRRRARRLDARPRRRRRRPDAQLARRGGRPRLRARLPLCGRGARSRTSRGSARRSCSGRPPSSASCGCPRTPSTGSSMMPQKLNPDVAELVRGKARNGDRAPRRAPRDGEGPAARLRPRPAGGQAARVRRAPRRPRLAPGDDGARQRPRREPRAARRGASPTRSCSPPTSPRTLVRGGRSVQGGARAGRGIGARRDVLRGDDRRGKRCRPAAPGPGGVRDAVAAARKRFGQGV